MIKCDMGRDPHGKSAGQAHDTGPLRDAVLAQTTRIIARRCWFRRSAVGLALVVCYLAGMGTMQAWRHDGPADTSCPLLAKSTSAVADVVPPSLTSEPQKTAAEVEPQAIVKKDGQKQRIPESTVPKRSRFEVMCEISDRYLYRDADTIAAIRGYRRALRVATPEEREICPQRDSWLLMALKQELN